MKTMYMNPAALSKWKHQNNAKYVGNWLDGVLLDNFTLSTKRGFAAVYEHYVNPNKSDYRIEYETGAAQNVWKNWYKFEAENESES